MQQTESKSIQVHPSDEQYFIDVMQKFHWNLQSTQTVDTKEAHTETRGDKIYSVINTEKYVKLHFSRPMNFPNKEKFNQLQSEYFSFQFHEKKSTKGPIYLILFGILFIGVSACSKTPFLESPFGWITILSIAGGGFWFWKILEANGKIAQANNDYERRRQEILNECDSLHLENPN